MKKTFHFFAALCIIAMTAFTFVGCTENHLDATLSFSSTIENHNDSGEEVTGTLTSDDFHKMIVDAFKTSGYEVGTVDNILIIRDQSSVNDANKKATAVFNKIKPILEAKKDDLVSTCTKLVYSFKCTCDGTTTEIGTVTIR